MQLPSLGLNPIRYCFLRKTGPIVHNDSNLEIFYHRAFKNNIEYIYKIIQTTISTFY